MNTAQLLTLLRTAWWKLAIGAIVGALVAVLLLAVLPKRYEAVSLVLVQVADQAAQPAPEAPDPAAVPEAPVLEPDQVKQMLPTYIAIAYSDGSVAGTAAAAGNGATPASVREDLVYTPAPEGPVIEVHGNAATPEGARKLADAGAKTLTEDVTAENPLGVDLAPTVLEAAAAPEKAASPSPLVVVPACVLAGIVLTLCWALLGAARTMGRRTA